MTNEMEILGIDEIQPFFHVLKENITRSRITMTIVFIKARSNNDGRMNEKDIGMQNKIQQLLISKVRNTDLLFKLNEPNEWGILLMQSVEKDAIAFLERLFQCLKEKDVPLNLINQYTLSAIITEIKTNRVDFNELLLDKNEVFHEVFEPWRVEFNTKYKTPEPQKIKVSIIENNEIFRGILKTTIQKIQTKNFNLEVSEYVDGFEFLQSGTHLSSHAHIVIMNDILPRKNGLEVLDTLRRLPNQRKFTIYMMTKRNSQNDIINAYERGADEYLMKPFDLRLFKSQILRTLERLQP